MWLRSIRRWAGVSEGDLKNISAHNDKWNSPAVFLSPYTNPHGNGHLTVKVINQVWDDVCKVADIKGKTPHSARHAMGRYIIEKTGNVAAVQQQQ